MKKFRFILLLLLFFVAGCASDPVLRGTMWRPKRVPPYIYLEVTEDGRALGEVAGSRFFAPLELNEEQHTMTFGSFASQRFPGQPQPTDLEKSFFEMLRGVRTYKIEPNYKLDDGKERAGATLILYDEKSEVIGRLISPFPLGKPPKNNR